MYLEILDILKFFTFIDKLIEFKDKFRTIEADFWKKLRTTEAHFDFTGPYKTKRVYTKSFEKFHQFYHTYPF